MRLFGAFRLYGCFLSVLLAAGCSAYGPAPVVYGDDEGHTGRIYRSAEEILPDMQAGSVPSGGNVSAGDSARTPLPASPAPVYRETLPALPVPDPVQSPRSARAYVVREGDTLYAIARRYDVSVSVLARMNGLEEPFVLEKGRVLRIVPPGMSSPAGDPAAIMQAPGDVASGDPFPDTVPREEAPDIPAGAVPAGPGPHFSWPVRGEIISLFGARTPGRSNDGINIAAPEGTPVRAAADGEVVYTGTGLDGFGNLVLVSHGQGYVTAYSHHDVMLVRKGDRVRGGQIIAKVGRSGGVTIPQLHFEIRHNLEAVDPMSLLELP